MGKVTSLYGKTTGKIGSIVFATAGGQTIAREYNPNVSNPSTQAQVNQRARLKLMSQISASLAPVIAIPKQGLVSSRNAFTKLNFDASYAQNGIAQISYENLQLTNGNLGLPTIEASRAQATGVSVNLSEDASQGVSRVVYILYRKTAEQKLQFVASVIAENGGQNGTFPATLPYTEGDIVLYAYGMRDTSESASAKYGNLQVQNAVDVAKLTAYRTISSEDYQFTETRGATMYANQSEITPVPEGSVRVFVTALVGGSVSGGGIYELGANASVIATPEQGYTFVGWKINGTNTIVSTNPTYTFQVTEQVDLVATFALSTDVQRVTVDLGVDTAGREAGVTATGGGSVTAGVPITIEAIFPQGADLEFAGWRDTAANQTISTQNPYTFTPNANITLIALTREGGL